jgi:hypothetical protein
MRKQQTAISLVHHLIAHQVQGILLYIEKLYKAFSISTIDLVVYFLINFNTVSGAVQVLMLFLSSGLLV